MRSAGATLREPFVNRAPVPLGITVVCTLVLFGAMPIVARAHEGTAVGADLSLPPAVELAPEHPRIRAGAAILLDGRTGEPLVAHGVDEPRAPASLTKILTALVVLERGRLSETVTISPAAARTGGYRLGLRVGQRVLLEDLVAAILIRSANDAAAAAAEHVGGSIRGFAALMNAEARALGLRNSHFVNPHGLDAPGHVSTARDLGRLTRVALEDPRFAEFVRASKATVTIWRVERGTRMIARRVPIASHNRLLGRLNGADGVKTGFTSRAGRCLVASATRGAQRLIAVLLDSDYRWREATQLLEYGFRVKTAANAPPRSLEGQPSSG